MGALHFAFLSILLLLLGVLFVIFGSLELEKDVFNENSQKLGVVIDAGGSGTRLIVYKYKDNDIKQLLFIDNCEDRGLTKWKDNELDYLRGNLTNCFQKGADNLPKGQKVPIYFAATAGMRLLELKDKEAHERIWKIINEVVDSSEFRKTAVMDTIKGTEEAKWAWVAANYLKNSSFGGQKYGTIDFGSSSLQIAFQQNFQTKISESQEVVQLDGKNISIYAHSYLCFGNDEIQRRFLAKLVKSSNYSTELSNPCFFIGFNKTYTSDYLWSEPCSSGNYSRDVLGEELVGPPNTSYIIAGSGNFSQCYGLLNNMISQNHNCTHNGSCGLLGTYQPKVHGSFFALSTFFHIGNFLQLSPSTGKDEYHKKADRYCSKSYEEISNKSSTPMKFLFPRCFQATYSYFLLASGFKFDARDWSIDYIKKIEGRKVGWPLGLMYSHKDNMHILVTRAVNKLREDGYLAMLIIGVFCVLPALMLAMIACKKATKSGKASVSV